MHRTVFGSFSDIIAEPASKDRERPPASFKVSHYQMVNFINFRYSGFSKQNMAGTEKLIYEGFCLSALKTVAWKVNSSFSL